MKITAVILALIAAVSAASVEQKSVAHYTYEDIREQELKCKADRNREWKYDAATKTYLRFNAGAAHMDFDTKQQLSAANVIVQFAKETNLGDYGKHMFYDVIGSGTGYVFQNGTATEITWKKANQKARTIFTDKAGKEIVFVPGNIWVEILPIGNKVVYN